MNRWMKATLGVAVVAALCGTAWADEVKDPAGKTLFLSNKCNSCHTIDAAGIQKKAAEGEAAPATASSHKVPDLSSIGADTKPDFLTKFLKKEATAKDGKKHMKLWKGTDADLATLVAWLGEQKAEKKAEGDKAAGDKAATDAKPATDQNAAPDAKAAGDKPADQNAAPADSKAAPEGNKPTGGDSK
jgi:cytochrome c